MIFFISMPIGRKKTAKVLQRAATISKGTDTRKASTLKETTTEEGTVESTFLLRNFLV